MKVKAGIYFDDWEILALTTVTIALFIIQFALATEHNEFVKSLDA